MISSTPPSIELSQEASRLLAQAADARIAMGRAARNAAVVADELRRYAKFSRPGQPSAHIVQLRRRQATARLDASRATQAFLLSAKGFMHAAGLTLPKGTTLEDFMLEWINLQH